MQKELIAELEALRKKLEAIKDNAACWKAARKLESAAAILANDWPPEKVSSPKPKV